MVGTGVCRRGIASGRLVALVAHWGLGALAVLDRFGRVVSGGGVGVAPVVASASGLVDLGPRT